MQLFLLATILLPTVCIAQRRRGSPVTEGVAVLSSVEKIRGTIVFRSSEEDGERTLDIKGVIRNLRPGPLYRLTLHQFGNFTNKCDSVGPLFALDRDDSDVILGRLGALKATEDGISRFHTQRAALTLNGARSVIGRAVVVSLRNSDIDDNFKEQKVACGVVGISKERERDSDF